MYGACETQLRRHLGSDEVAPRSVLAIVYSPNRWTALVRYLGLASHFVSGYSHGPAAEAGNGATHAWAAVYLAGPGGNAFDSTTGKVTGSRHIPVAVARDPEAVPPFAGSFIGPSGSAPTLAVNVRVITL